MDWWLIVLISVASFAFVIFFVILLAYFTYKIAFFADRRKDDGEYLEKVKESYGKYGDAFAALVENVSTGECERVFIESCDGLKLSARYYHKKDGAPLHILFHGYRSRAEFDMSGAAYECMNLSHNVLLVDQRAHGMSEGESISFGIKERWLRFRCKGFNRRFIFRSI